MQVGIGSRTASYLKQPRQRLSIFPTTGKNMKGRQNLKGRTIALVVLGNSQWRLVQRHVRRTAAAVNGASAGSYAEVEIPFD